MGTWYLSLAVSLFLILVGIYIHWTVVMAGLLLPFVPMISILLERRRRRAGNDSSESDKNLSGQTADGRDAKKSGD